MIKYIAIVAVVGIIAAVMVFNSNNNVTYTNTGTSTPEVIEKEVTPDWANDEDAVKAAKDVIRRKELEKQEAELVADITEKQEQLDAVRKELGTY